MQILSFCLISILISGILFSAPAVTLPTQPACTGVSSRFSPNYNLIKQRLEADPSEIALETEWPLPAAAKYLDSVDGKVGSLLDYVKGSPQGSNGRTIAVNQIFRNLSNEDRVALIRYIVENREVPFATNRNYIGLKLIADATDQKIDLTKIFLPTLKYDHPDNPSDIAYIEAHVRGKFVAGELNERTWKLEETLGIGKRSHHIHNVARLPLEWLAKDPARNSAEMLEALIRANYVAEFTTIIDRNRSISISQQGSNTLFGNLTQKQISIVYDYLYKRANGQYASIEPTTKIAWVSFRGDELYDKGDMFGWEFRSANRFGPDAVVNELATSIQYWTKFFPEYVERGMYDRWWTRLQKTTLKKKKLSQEDVEDVLVAAWYNQPWADLLQDYSSGHGIKIPKEFAKMAAESYDSRNLEAKMLFFDWSKTSVVSDDVGLMNNIWSLQEQYVAKSIERNSVSSSDVKIFLTSSGIFDKFNNTFVTPK